MMDVANNKKIKQGVASIKPIDENVNKTKLKASKDTSKSKKHLRKEGGNISTKGSMYNKRDHLNESIDEVIALIITIVELTRQLFIFSMTFFIELIRVGILVTTTFFRPLLTFILGEKNTFHLEDFTFKALGELTSPSIGPVRKRARLLPSTRWIEGFSPLGNKSSGRSGVVQFESESEEEDATSIDGNFKRRSGIRGGSILGSIIQIILGFYSLWYQSFISLVTWAHPSYITKWFGWVQIAYYKVLAVFWFIIVQLTTEGVGA